MSARVIFKNFFKWKYITFVNVEIVVRCIMYVHMCEAESVKECSEFLYFYSCKAIHMHWKLNSCIVIFKNLGHWQKGKLIYLFWDKTNFGIDFSFHATMLFLWEDWLCGLYIWLLITETYYWNCLHQSGCERDFRIAAKKFIL